MKTQNRHSWHFVIAMNPQEDMSMRHRRNLFLGMFIYGVIGIVGLAAGPVGATHRPGHDSGLNACASQLATCTNDLDACQAEPVCGDGIVEAGEDCDVGTLNGATCPTEGFAGGTLACGTGCTFDTSGCFADRFVDNGDGTITDHQTGLMWQKQIGGTSWEFDSQGVGNCRNCVNDSYTWHTAVSEWLAALNGRTTDPDTQTGYAGYSDWRLPTPVELQTIRDPAAGGCGGWNSGPCVNAIFNDSDSFTQPFSYWSSASGVSWGVAWCVGFTTGPVAGQCVETDKVYVRAVRGGW